ncbi:Chromosomal replication initiator protein DnaA [Lysobacter dokdonensis DS-58]|uniref:Chromosomal replication initiator protein DnaA n=1 Tax=Lysobacter dokdonensis DS-58 TaxID=1300345 RepID=A0A0A2WDD8_9GAMM|nr:DnaA regulatory inactivator Hda [Lysobacter dokdonensis]KGQ17748.1 Chromosomal replication initiator protein DnaA [Lysobacter dokdonensis DS-58]
MPAPQLPLALRYPPDQRLDTFVGAPDGALAQVRALAEGAAGEWLYVAGPAGVGKTHLLLAACAMAESAGRSAAYLPLKSAAGRLRDALDAFDGMALVALDGLEAIAGAREDEVALFDFHNRARQSGANVLYAAHASPDQLALTLPDLRSRLAQCARVVLSPLDDDARRTVLRARAQRRGLVLEEAAMDWLLRRRGRDLATLTGLLDELDRASLAAQRRITVPFLREVLRDE